MWMIPSFRIPRAAAYVICILRTIVEFLGGTVENLGRALAGVTPGGR